MSYLGDRLLSLEHRKHRVVGGSHRTVHLEQATYAAGTNPLYKGAKTVSVSTQIVPDPVIREISDEDIAQAPGNKNLQLGDFFFEIVGDSVTEDQLKAATQLTLDKGTANEKTLEILQYSPGKFFGSGRHPTFAIFGETVQLWSVVARGQIDK
jgi:hypothetical protein